MSAIQQLLQRWGFVKLDRYGLELSSDGRILSKRPAILEDGSGARVVGWQDDDLAMAELRPWQPGTSTRVRRASEIRPASPTGVSGSSLSAAVRAAASPVAAQSVASGVGDTRPAYPQVISEASVMAQVPDRASAGVMAEPVAGEPVVDEDDWEWTIALARARTAVEDVESTAPPRAAAKAPTKQARPSTPAPVVAPAGAGASGATPREQQRTRPIAVVAVRDPAASGEWPKTETIGTIDYEDDFRQPTKTAILYAAAPSAPRAVTPASPVARAAKPTPAPSVARAAKPTPAPSVPHAATPTTVIPVPALPTVQTTALTGRLEPVVRTAAAAADAAAKRLAKGTGPVPPRAPSRTASSMTDDTQPDLSIGDRTTPGIAMPMAARAVQLPSVKRRALQRG